MSHNSSVLESFLTEFHNRTPGLTSRALGTIPITCHDQLYSSTYALLASAVPASNGETRVLDLACGNGFLLSLLESREQPDLALSGIDMSSGELLRAREILQGGTELVEGNAQRLPWAPHTFHHVLCHMAFMLMENVENVIQEIIRVMKPSGTFAAIVGAPAISSTALQIYREVFLKYQRKSGLEKIRFGDPRTRTRDGIHALLSPGFSHVEIHDIEIRLRFTPEEVWERISKMYDMALIHERDGASLRHDYLPLIQSACGLDGKLDYEEKLRFFSARRNASHY